MAVIHLYFYGTISRSKYYSRSFHLKSNKGCNLPSGICIAYSFFFLLLFMTKCGVGEGGFGDSLNIHPEDQFFPPKPHFFVSWLQPETKDGLLILQESSLIFLFLSFFFLDPNLLFSIALEAYSLRCFQYRFYITHFVLFLRDSYAQ